MYPFPIHDTLYADIYLSVHAYVLFQVMCELIFYNKGNNYKNIHNSY